MKKTTKKNEPQLIKYQNEDTNEIKKLLLILICIVAIVFLLFFITSKYLLKDGFQNNDVTSDNVEIIYNRVDVGTMFNRPYDEYYVFAFDSKSDDSDYYNALMNRYSGNTKIYTLDLSIPKNSVYVKEKANKAAKNVSDLAFTSVNLIHIKNGKIDSYLDDIKEIEKKLK